MEAALGQSLGTHEQWGVGEVGKNWQEVAARQVGSVWLQEAG